MLQLWGICWHHTAPKKRQAPSKWVILYDHFYDWPDIICPKSWENKYSLYSYSIQYVFLQKHKHLLEIIPIVDGISQFSIGTTSSLRVCFPFQLVCYQRVPHLHTQHFPIPDRSFRLILSSTWRMAAARRWERSSACEKAVLWVNRWDHPKKEHPGKTKCARCFLVAVAVVRGFVLMEMNSVAAVFHDKTISRGGFLEDKWCFRIRFGLQFYSCILECFYNISQSDVHSPKESTDLFLLYVPGSFSTL